MKTSNTLGDRLHQGLPTLYSYRNITGENELVDQSEMVLAFIREELASQKDELEKKHGKEMKEAINETAKVFGGDVSELIDFSDYGKENLKKLYRKYGLSPEVAQPERKAKYKLGDIVRGKWGSREGKIIEVWKYPTGYSYEIEWDSKSGFGASENELEKIR